MGDLRATDDNADVRCDLTQDANHAASFDQVPDVDAEGDDAWGFRQQLLNDARRRIVDGEFTNRRARLQLAEIRQQVAQSHGRMAVPCIERAEQDVGRGHGEA